MSSSVSFKQKLFSACVELLNEKIKSLYTLLNDLTAGAENDAKSSAGDKHETSRTMMQIEHENISRQLEGLLKEKNVLSLTDIDTGAYITKGSLIHTNHGYIFLSVALGKIKVDTTEVMVLSPQSPIGRKLSGLTEGDSVEVNNTQYSIEEVL
jgi:transcription elongation GreA/GreB family factor